VTTGVPIIDLDSAPPGPDRARRLARPRFAVPRAGRALAVLLLTIAAAGAAGAPAPGLRPVLPAGVAANGYTLGEDTFYTSAYGMDNPNGEAVVRRYDLADGSVRWTAMVSQGVQDLAVRDVAGVLMARSGTDPRISFLDTATGAVLWRSELADTTVLALQDDGVLLRTDRAPGEWVLRLADPRTGRTVWTRTVDPRLYVGPTELWSGDADRIVTVGADGGVVTMDFRTGRVLARGDLGEPDAAGAVPHTAGPDRLLVYRRDAAGASLTAYGLTPFRWLWRSDDSAGVGQDCGPVLCTGWSPDGATDTTLTGIDPTDGSLRWTAPGWQAGARFDDRTVLAVNGRGEPDLAFLDALTGRLVRRLGTVAPVGDLMLDRDSAQPGRTWVLAGRRLRSLGAVGVAAPYSCIAAGRHLACPTSTGTVQVWRRPD
jgi:hypothetical protein